MRHTAKVSNILGFICFHICADDVKEKKNKKKQRIVFHDTAGGLLLRFGSIKNYVTNIPKARGS